MSEIPVDSRLFERYIKENKLFEKAQNCLKSYLKEWYADSARAFEEDMRAPFEKVIKEYTFQNSLSVRPPLTARAVVKNLI